MLSSQLAYAVEFDCNAALAAWVCNFSKAISLVVLLCVANLSAAAPHSLAPALLAASATLLGGASLPPPPP